MFAFLSCHNSIIELNLVSHDALETQGYQKKIGGKWKWQKNSRLQLWTNVSKLTWLMSFWKKLKFFSNI
jgi:hypothetical protein